YETLHNLHTGSNDLVTGCHVRDACSGGFGRLFVSAADPQFFSSNMRWFSSVIRTDLEWSFFFQAEDGIRDFHVTGVQTCALPISRDDMRIIKGMDISQLSFLGQAHCLAAGFVKGVAAQDHRRAELTATRHLHQRCET